jgi:hypothetical protein
MLTVAARCAVAVGCLVGIDPVLVPALRATIRRNRSGFVNFGA